MNAAARATMKEIPDIDCAYGMSDEFRCDLITEDDTNTNDLLTSFMFDRSSKIFQRRER